ncbi:MAG: hypothetical protein ACHQRJ_12930 [Alphaproteobacteria bacterium]
MFSSKPKTAKAATPAAPAVDKAKLIQIIKATEGQADDLHAKERELVAERRRIAPLAHMIGPDSEEAARLLVIRGELAAMIPIREELAEAIEGLKARLAELERLEAVAAQEARKVALKATVLARIELADRFDSKLRELATIAEVLWSNAHALDDYGDLTKKSFDRSMSSYACIDAVSAAGDGLRKLFNFDHTPPGRRVFTGVSERARWNILYPSAELGEVPAASAPHFGFTPAPKPKPKPALKIVPKEGEPAAALVTSGPDQDGQFKAVPKAMLTPEQLVAEGERLASLTRNRAAAIAARG